MKKFVLIALTTILLGLGAISCSPEDNATYYNVSFDADGGTPEPVVQRVKAGDRVKAPVPEPERSGYAFLFWSLTGTSTAYDFQTPVNSDITLVAKWQDEATVEYWQVSWVLNGGQWPSNDNHAVKVVKGGTLAEPAAPTKADNAFEGWYKEAALTNKVAFPYNVSAEAANITLYAKWRSTVTGKTLTSIAVTAQPEKKEYNVGETFDPTGMEITATYSDNTSVLVNVTAENFTYDFSTAGNKTVTITFEGKTATVTGITVEDYGPKADYFGAWRNIPSEGYVFEQFTIGANRIEWLNGNGSNCLIEDLTWTEVVNSKGDFVADYATGYRISGTMTRSNNISFKKPDGKTNYAVGDVVVMSYYLYSDKESIRVGNLGSAEQEAYYGPYNIDSWWLQEQDIDINAYWNVSWELNGGQWPANDNHVTKALKNGMLAAPANPTRPNWNFAGWSSNSNLNGTTLFPYDVNYQNGDFTLYAKWTDASPSVTLRITVQPTPTISHSITIMRVSAGTPSRYNVPTNPGTHTVMVSPGTYYVYVSHWSCPYVQCMASGRSGNFTVSAGQGKNISVVGSAVGM